ARGWGGPGRAGGGAGQPGRAGPARPPRPGCPRPPAGGNKHPPLPPRHMHHVYTVVVGGMPGWQIAVIAAGAALLAATAAVVVYRAWAGRRNQVTAATEPSVAGADAQLLSAP